MLELIIAVCLSAEPARCKEVTLTFLDEQISPRQCMTGAGAQFEISKWLEANPKWRMTRWTCAAAGRLAKI